MRIAICDDVKEYRLLLKAYISDYFERKTLPVELFEYDNGIDIINASKSFDILFLDIELGDITGIEIAEIILKKNRNTIIIIVTSYNQYLDAAMDLHVIRYISKPIIQDKIFSALDRALLELENSTISVHLKDNRIIRIRLADIVCVEAKLKKVHLFTVSEEYVVRDSLKALKSQIHSTAFSTPHNSYLVNFNYVSEFKRNEIRLKEPYENVRISIASRKQAEFKRKFLDYIGEGKNG